jgi:hypothetical protein
LQTELKLRAQALIAVQCKGISQVADGCGPEPPSFQIVKRIPLLACDPVSRIKAGKVYVTARILKLALRISVPEPLREGFAAAETIACNERAEYFGFSVQFFPFGVVTP